MQCSVKLSDRLYIHQPHRLVPDKVPGNELRIYGDLTDRLGFSIENPIDHRDLEGIVVKLVNSSAVAQAKQTRSGFDPFERWLLHAFLIFKNRVSLSVIVNEFKFVYLVGFYVFHNPSPLPIV
jgi:hypothetical protein